MATASRKKPPSAPPIAPSRRHCKPTFSPPPPAGEVIFCFLLSQFLLFMISPTKYKPMSPDEFVGETAHYARILANTVSDSRENGFESIKFLLNGPPGCGKTALVHYLQSLLGADEFDTRKFNGTEVKLETVNDMSQAMHYAAMNGDYRLFWIDEADKITPVAQVRFLTMLDDLPDGVAIACTSNCKVEEFEARFQSRFQVFELTPPSAEEIETLLARWPLPPETVRDIAKGARGNVRQALLDARTALNAAR